MPNIYVKKIKNILTNNTSGIGKIKPKVPYFHFCCVLRKKKKKKKNMVGPSTRRSQLSFDFRLYKHG